MVGSADKEKEMKLTIIKRGDETGVTDALRRQIERRAGFALSRFSDELGSVLVRLDDLNGPRGGIDKRCRVQLRGPDIGELVVEETDAEWTPAIDRTFSLAARSVARALDKARPERSSRFDLPGEA
jgi:hypothetical protein